VVELEDWIRFTWLVVLLMLSAKVCLATDFQWLSDKTWQHAGTRTSSFCLWVGDVDRDGFIEMVSGGYRFNPTTTYTEACIRVYRYIPLTSTWIGEGARKWSCPAGNIYVTDVAVDDADRDGEPEIITVGYFFNGTHYKYQLKAWFKARGNKAPVKENTLNDIFTNKTILYGVAIGDVDKDGWKEVVTVGLCLPQITGGYQRLYTGIFSYSEDSGFSAEAEWWVGAGSSHWSYEDVAIGDVDHDGDIEIVAVGHRSNGVGVLRIFGWSGIIPIYEASDYPQYDTYTTKLYRVALGDVDSDGDVEIVVSGYVEGQGYIIYIYHWNGTTLDMELEYPVNPGYDIKPYGLGIGDVDDDGEEEIVVAYYYLLTDGYYVVSVTSKRYDGSTITQEDYYTFFYSEDDTYVRDLCINDADQDGEQEVILTGRTDAGGGMAYLYILNS